MMSDEVAMGASVRLVLAMMRSASTDKIRPIDWWTRAKSALETAAASASDLSQMVAVMGRKLQIDATSSETSKEICSLAELVGGDFEAVRRLCEEQSLYVVAIAQGQRQEQRERRATNAAKPDLRETLTVADIDNAEDLR